VALYRVGLTLIFVLLTSSVNVIAENYSIVSKLPSDNYLLTTRAEINAALEKAKRLPWAKKILYGLISDAEKALRLEIKIPERNGPEGLFACPTDGFRLNSSGAGEFKCPACGSVYKGRPYKENDHRPYSQAIRDLGLAYRFTGREEFLTKAKQILLAYSDLYPKFKKHGEDGEGRPNNAPNGAKLFMQTLGEARWLVPVVWGYSLVKGALAESERNLIEKNLLIPAAEILRAHHWGVHNKQSWMNAGFGLVGFATGNQTMVQEAIEDKQRGFKTLVAKGVMDDGLWNEGSTSYHAMTRQAMTYLAEAAWYAGINLYSDRFLKMYDVPLLIGFPDGHLPVFNDSSGGTVTGAASFYEILFARTSKPEYGRVVSDSSRDSIHSLLQGVETLPSGPVLPEQSTILPSTGIAMLRSKEVAVAIRFGIHGGWHGHFDKMGIITYGLGKYFGTDPGSAGYSNPLHDDWNRTTLSHNTVVMSTNNQAGLNNFKIEEWKVKAGSTLLVVSSDAAYSDAVLKLRHMYDWAFHSPGKFECSLKLKPYGMKLGKSDGYQMVENISEAVTDSDWWASWQQDNVRLTIYFKGSPGTEVFAGEGPSQRGMIPMIIVRKRGVGVSFDTTHVFEKK
jgi:hypothetical protein